MQLLVIFIEILGYVGPAFAGAVYLSIFSKTDFGFWQLTMAGLAGGFVWWLINSSLERAAWRKISGWFSRRSRNRRNSRG